MKYQTLSNGKIRHAFAPVGTSRCGPDVACAECGHCVCSCERDAFEDRIKARAVLALCTGSRLTVTIAPGAGGGRGGGGIGGNGGFYWISGDPWIPRCRQTSAGISAAIDALRSNVKR